RERNGTKSAAIGAYFRFFRGAALAALFAFTGLADFRAVLFAGAGAGAARRAVTRAFRASDMVAGAERRAVFRTPGSASSINWRTTASRCSSARWRADEAAAIRTTG